MARSKGGTMIEKLFEFLVIALIILGFIAFGIGIFFYLRSHGSDHKRTQDKTLKANLSIPPPPQPIEPSIPLVTAPPVEPKIQPQVTPGVGGARAIIVTPGNRAGKVLSETNRLLQAQEQFFLKNWYRIRDTTRRNFQNALESQREAQQLFSEFEQKTKGMEILSDVRNLTQLARQRGESAFNDAFRQVRMYPHNWDATTTYLPWEPYYFSNQTTVILQPPVDKSGSDSSGSL